jgi:RND family efflux transporter MFP subunit
MRAQFLPLLALLALLAACTPAEEAPGGGHGGGRAALVRTEAVELGDLREAWRIAGSVRARRSSTLSAAVAGRVTAVTAREGDEVATGAVLVRMHAGRTEAALAGGRASVIGAEAAAERAEATWGRVQAMGDDGLVSPEDRDAARIEARMRDADLERASADVLRLEQELSDHRVRAPYAAVVVARHVDEGAWASPGTPLLEVSERGVPEVEMRVPESRLRRLQAGQEATILRGFDRFPATIDAVVPAVDPDSRQGLVRLLPADPSIDLLPGAPVEVELEVLLVPDALRVPRDALQDGPRGTYVLVVREGKAAIVALRVLEQAGEVAAVSPLEPDALVAGDRVVVRGGERLRPGQDVKDSAMQPEQEGGPGPAGARGGSGG